jgi:hypothetical protein
MAELSESNTLELRIAFHNAVHAFKRGRPMSLNQE